MQLKAVSVRLKAVTGYTHGLGFNNAAPVSFLRWLFQLVIAVAKHVHQRAANTNEKSATINCSVNVEFPLFISLKYEITADFHNCK